MEDGDGTTQRRHRWEKEQKQTSATDTRETDKRLYRPLWTVQCPLQEATSLLQLKLTSPAETVQRHLDTKTEQTEVIP